MCQRSFVNTINLVKFTCAIMLYNFGLYNFFEFVLRSADMSKFVTPRSFNVTIKLAQFTCAIMLYNLSQYNFFLN